MYLTPERFKTMGTGVDLSEVEDVALRSAISRAMASVHAYCAVPNVPQMHSFRGGTITSEEHVYAVDEWERPRPFALWPWHTPVSSVNDLRLIFGVQNGNETFLDIEPDNLFISDQGYVEVSSLNLSQLVFADAVMPYIGLHRPSFRIGYDYGTTYVVVDDVCEPVDAKTYQASNQVWTSAAVEVKVDEVVVTTGFTLNRFEGWVVFDVNQDPGALVQVSYTHELHNDIMQAMAILTAREIGIADLRAKGMEGLVSVRVKDVEIRRSVAAKSTGTSGSAAVVQHSSAPLTRATSRSSSCCSFSPVPPEPA